MKKMTVNAGTSMIQEYCKNTAGGTGNYKEIKTDGGTIDYECECNTGDVYRNAVCVPKSLEISTERKEASKQSAAELADIIANLPSEGCLYGDKVFAVGGKWSSDKCDVMPDGSKPVNAIGCECTCGNDGKWNCRVTYEEKKVEKKTIPGQCNYDGTTYNHGYADIRVCPKRNDDKYKFAEKCNFKCNNGKVEWTIQSCVKSGPQEFELVNDNCVTKQQKIEPAKTPIQNCTEDRQRVDHNVVTAEFKNNRCEVTSCRTGFEPSDNKLGCKIKPLNIKLPSGASAMNTSGTWLATPNNSVADNTRYNPTTVTPAASKPVYLRQGK